MAHRKDHHPSANKKKDITLSAAGILVGRKRFHKNNIFYENCLTQRNLFKSEIRFSQVKKLYKYFLKKTCFFTVLTVTRFNRPILL